MSYRSSTILSPDAYEALQQLMSTLIGSRSPLAAILREKLGAADVIPPGDIDPDVVTMGSTVRYRIGDTALPEEARLVRGYPRSSSRDALSILNPRGLAMLGLKSGESITIPSSNGRSETLFVDAVAGRHDLASSTRHHRVGSVVAFSPARLRANRLSVTSSGDDPGPAAA
jgi:regulator of nucleoside diphosphate kinase